MKRILRLSAAIVIPAVLLIALVIGSGNTSVHAQQEGTPSPTPAATPQSGPPRSNDQVPHAGDVHPPKYDNLTSLLNEIVVQYEEGALTARAAASTAPIHGEESVEVTFHIEEAHVRDVWDYLQENNVPAREPLEDEHFIEAEVPVSLLGDASQQPGVFKVKPITPNQPAQGTIGGQGATAHGADAWHDEGYKGQGVKVGVIDLGFTGFSDLQGTELPSSVEVKCAEGTTLSDCTGSSKHGTGVTEILYDVAPDASYYIYLATTKGDWKRAVDWMVEQGVDVINASISREWDGPGDGTSPYTDSPLKAVDAAVTGGSVFVTSAGNEGQSTWYGSFTDADDDGVLEFSTDDECNGVELVADKTFIAQLRWNDPWASSRKDLDLYLRPIRNGVPGLEVARSSDWQDGDAGDVPHEAVYYTPGADGSYCLSVEQKTLGAGSSSVLPSWVQLQSYIGPSLEHSTTSHGITTPAGTRNAGALAVGAAHWNDTATIYAHSSRGPLPDGTIKPDIVGAHYVETSTYGSSSSGTSFASPHVAGLAALVKQVYSSRSPSAIATYLRDNALGRDTVPNNTWGYGFAQLPAPSTDATLSALTLSGIDFGTFSSRTTSYSASVGNDVSETTVTPTLTDSNASYVIRIGGAADADGRVALAVGENVITIEVTADDGETAETYTVTVTRASDPCGGPVSADTTIEGSWDDTCLSEKAAPGAAGDRFARFYNFTLSDAADVIIMLTSDEDTYLYLLDGHGKGGTTLHENDDIEAGGVNLNSRISVSLQAGDYTVEATTYNAEIEGAFTLTIEGLDVEPEPEPDPEPEAEACESAVSADGTLEGNWDDTCLSEKDALGGTGDRYARFYTFTLAEAADVTTTLTSDEDAYLYILDGHGKDGTTLHENDDIEAGVNLNSRISVSLQAGNYTIEATTYSAAKSGAFTLEIEGLGEATTTQPDLEVGAPSVDDANPSSGATFTLSATVTNAGDGESAATTLRYYRSTNSTISSADTEVGTDDVEALAAAATSDQSIELTAPSTAGTYYYGACVDAVADESDTTDNCSTAVTVPVLQSDEVEQGTPNLGVGTPSVDDSSPETEATFTLSATVTNSGDGESEATTLRYYQSTDDTITSEDTEVGTDSVGALAASGTSDQSIDLSAPAAAGTYYYGACVDAVTDESDTTDNCSSAVTVEVEEPTTGPDLEVETPSVDDASPETGATFTLSATVTNEGDEESAATTLRYYKSADSAITTSDTEVGTDSVGALAVAGTTDQSINLTAPSTAGTYYYGACVDSVIDESDTTDNCSSPVTVIVVETQQQQGSPDLEVGTPSVDDSTLQAGSRFTLSATVANAGDGESASTTLRYYRSTDSTITTSDTQVGTDAVGALAATGTSAESISLTAPSTAGAYYYGACVDAVADESDTTNNCSADVRVDVSDTTTTPPRTTRPDIEVGTPSVNDASLETNEAFTLSVTVSNTGDGVATATTLRYYRSTDSTITTSDIQIGTNSVGALAVAGTSDQSISLNAPSIAGTYYYGACADAVTDESDSTNNCSSSVTVTVLQAQGSPSLSVTSSLSKSDLETDESFTLSSTVANVGDAASDPLTLRYFRGATRTTALAFYNKVSFDSVGVLAAGDSSDHSRTLTAPSSGGTFYYMACVVRSGASDSSAISCSSPMQVAVLENEDTATGNPDLSFWNTFVFLTDYSGRTSSLSVNPSTDFWLYPIVRNYGDLTSPSTTLRYYRSTDSTITTSDTQVATYTVEVLAAGGTDRFSAKKLTAPSTEGTYYYGGCVDSVRRETNTTNNCSPAMTLEVVDPNDSSDPDLEVGTFSVSDTRTWPGETLTLSATVTNKGDMPSEAATLRYYRSTNRDITSSDTEVGTDSISALAADGASDQSIDLISQRSLGVSYYYGACVDVVTDETSTVNNCSRGVEVRVQSAFSTFPYFPSVNDASLGAGEAFTLSVWLSRQGSAGSTSHRPTLRYYRSTDWIINTSDTQVGSEIVRMPVTGSSYQHSYHLSAPSTAGTYYYGVCFDPIPPDTRANNCSPGGVAVTVEGSDSARPDFTVSLTTSDSEVTRGTRYTLTATVTNSGDGQFRNNVRKSLRFHASWDTLQSYLFGIVQLNLLAPGESASISSQRSARHPYEEYYYSVCLDLASGESDWTNNCSSRVAVTTVEELSTARPDLTVSASVSDTVVQPSSSLTLSATVTNSGGAASSATTLRYYRSSDSTISSSDTQVGTDAVGALAIDGTSDQTIDLKVPSSTGTYYYGACVDRVTDESDTSNDCSDAVKVTLKYPPDLDVLGGSGYQIPLVPGGSFYLTTRLENEGKGPSAATTLRYYRSDDTTITTSDTEVGTKEVEALAAGAIVHKRIDLTAPSTPGTYYYGSCVDAVPDESDKTNNCTRATTLVVPVPAPDLTVLGSLSKVHSILAPGIAVTLTALVLNAGAEDAEASTLRYYRSDEDQTISSADTLLDTDEIAALDSGDSSEYSIDITAPLAPGSYHFGACVDTVTDELVTDNNCSFGRWMGVTTPDLVVGTPTLDDASPDTGEKFTLSATVTNTGGRDAAATTLRYYRSTDATITSDDTEVGTDDVSALENREDSDQSIELTAPATAGTYYYGACVDTVTYEYDTEDNCSASVKVVATAPNLQVGTPTVDDASPDAGATFTLSATVTNAGDRAAVATTLRYYQSTDATITSADTELGTDDISALAAAGTSDQSIDLTAPSETGTYYYGACVDAVTDESDATDNCSGSVSITVE